MEPRKSRIDEFLERVRAADESQKRRWLAGSVAVIGILVVYLWIANFSFMMSGYAMQATASDTASQSSFFGTVFHGFTVMGGNIWNGFRVLENTLATPREYIVKPPQ